MGLLTHLKRLFLPVIVQVTHPYCHCLVDDLPAHSQAASLWKPLSSQEMPMLVLIEGRSHKRLLESGGRER